MLVKIDENIAIEVGFSAFDREDGFDDDIRFCINECGPRDRRISAADETSVLLTPEQAEQLAVALKEAADASRGTSR